MKKIILSQVESKKFMKWLNLFKKRVEKSIKITDFQTIQEYNSCVDFLVKKRQSLAIQRKYRYKNFTLTDNILYLS